MNKQPTTTFKTELHSEEDHNGTPITVWEISYGGKAWYCAKSPKSKNAIEQWCDTPEEAIKAEQTNLDNPQTNSNEETQIRY